MATVTINTGKANIPPEAIITFVGGSQLPVTFTGGKYTANLDASISNDPDDGIIISYVWEYRVNGGSWINFASTSGPFTNYVISNTGIWEFRVTVYDETDLSTISNSLTVDFTQEAPINCDAKINGNNFIVREIVPPGSYFVLNGSDSTPGNENAIITSYQWSILSEPVGSSTEVINPVTSNTSIGKLDVIGIYYVRLSIRSSNGTTDQITVEIEVKDTDENGNFI